MRREYLTGRATLHQGDCIELLAAMPDASLDSCCCDPPYGLQFMGRKWDKLWRNEREADKSYVERTKGQLTSRARRLPDYSASKPAQMQEFHQAWAEQVLRVLKPGGYLLAFSSTRTYHRMACAIEDAGFEIRDMISWTYGSGFPKSHDAGNGWGTALKPAVEPIVMARKPLIGTVAENVLRYGTGALNIDGCRIGVTDEAYAKNASGDRGHAGNRVRDMDFAMGCGRAHDGGRWPANLVHDGSDEVLAVFPDTGISSGGRIGNAGGGDVQNLPVGQFQPGDPGFGDSGSAARFFYTAKADGEDRLGSKHPTVKPVDLMQWLVRLVTPKGGLVLDPFAGTGTTGEAAWREGMRAVLIEREDEYCADIERRMQLADNPTKRAAVGKSKNQLEDPNNLPLFRTDSLFQD